MRRVVLPLSIATAVAVLAWPSARRGDPGDAAGSVCALMTPAKLLENPGLAHAYAEALRSGDEDEVGRIRDLLHEIRSAHGCDGDVALPGAASAHPGLPPGHPPVRGHSPDGRGMRDAPRLEVPGTVEI